MTREEQLLQEISRLNKIIDALAGVQTTTSTTSDYIGGRPNDRG